MTGWSWLGAFRRVLPLRARRPNAGGVVELYQDRAGQWRWRLRGTNAEIMAQSSEGYGTLYDCQRAVAQVTAALPASAQVVLSETGAI